MVFDPDLQAELRQANGTLVAELTHALNIEWEDLISEVGSGSLEMPGDDPDAAELTVGRDIFLYYRGTLAQHLVIQQPPARSRHAEGEEAEQMVVLSAPNVLDEWAHVRVTPFRGWDGTGELPLPFLPQHRLYTFATPEYEIVNTGDPADWHPATQQIGSTEFDTIRNVPIEFITVVSDGDDIVEELPVPAPLEWKVPEAFWVWSQADSSVVGYSFFAETITIAEETTLTFDVTCDNTFKMFIDGHPVLGNEEPLGWQDYKEYRETFKAGTYEVRWVCRNLPGPGDNPAGLLYAIYEADNDGDVVNLIAFSSSATLALAYPAEWPGLTAGDILVDMLWEAQQRQILMDWTFDFTGLVDSDGDPFPQIPLYSTPVGSSFLDVLKDLKKQGWIDFHAQPGSRTLQVWNASDGYASSVVFEVTEDVDTQNLRFSDFEPVSDVPLSALQVKWADSYVRVYDPAVAATWRPREGSVSIDAATEDEAIRVGLDILAKNNEPHWSNVVAIAPTGPGDAPYFGFEVGWRVTAPDVVTGTKLRRVQAIQMSQNDEGVAEPILDLENRVEPDTAPFEDLIEDLGRGNTGSRTLRNTGQSTGGGGGGSGSARTRATANSASTRPIYEGSTIRGQRKVYVPETVSAAGGDGGLSALVWTYGGVVAPTVATDLGYDPATQAFTITEFIVTIVETDPSQDYIVRLVVDNVIQTSVTLTATSGEVTSGPISVAVSPGDQVTARVAEQVNGVGSTLVAKAVVG